MHHILRLLLVLLPLTTHAQLPVLWGMTPMGGADNKGTIFRVDGDGTDFLVMHHFSDADGYAPEGTLCLASNGKLYGTTNVGGTASPAAGTLFSFDLATSTYTKLVDFDISNGGFGWGGMIAHPDGKLYGATYGGGGSGGSIFRLDPATDTYTILHPLDQATEGGSINNRLSVGDDGLLYGSGGTGGVNNAGTLFRFDPGTNTFTLLYEFDGALNGRTPYGGITDGGNGWFYGTTWEGGSDDEGILFKYAPSTNTFVKLIDFTGPNGQSPWSSPVRLGTELYGTVTLGGAAGGGYVYHLDPATDAITVLHAFNLLDGGTLFGNVTGIGTTLYGAGSFGGTNYQGTVYAIDPLSGTLTTLHSFMDPSDGYSPRGDLVAAGTAIVGVEERAPEAGLHVMPNPADGAFTVAVPGGGANTVRLRDGLGRIVYAERAEGTMVQVEPSLAAGAYLLEVANAQRTLTTRVVLR